MPAASASGFTGGAASCIPRPTGRSGCVTHERDLMSRRDERQQRGHGELQACRKRPASSLILGALPLAGFLQLADLAQDEIALQRADAEDEEDAVEVIDLMLEGTRQQLFAFESRTTRRRSSWALTLTFGARDDLLANVGQAEAAFFLVPACLRLSTISGLMRTILSSGFFWKLRSMHGDALARRRSAARPGRCPGRRTWTRTCRRPVAEFLVEHRDRLGRPLQDRVGILDHRSNHEAAIS